MISDLIHDHSGSKREGHADETRLKSVRGKSEKSDAKEATVRWRKERRHWREREGKKERYMRQNVTARRED